MKYLEVSFPTPEENLACDEALLEEAEERGSEGLLRLWEPNNYFVVLGYANRVASEVKREYCAAHGIPLFRRCSGGGTVLQGPGCLNYSLVLPSGQAAALRSISGTNRFILERHQSALARLLERPVEINGCSDLSLGNLKFSGNAQRRKRNFLLFHGTFLVKMDLGLIEDCLAIPEKQPGYRSGRPHGTFLTNLPIDLADLRKTLLETWSCTEAREGMPHSRIGTLVREKYSVDAWNLKF